MKTKNSITTLALIVTAVSLLLLNCSKERVESTEELTEYEPATQFLETLKPEEQTFEIDGSGTDPIVGKDSTKIWIETEQLEDENGDTVHTPYMLYLLELYTPKDLISYQISNLAQSKLLHNGGVIRIRIEKDGKEVNLREGNTWLIEIPSNQPETEMEIYYGTESNPGVNWANIPEGDFTATSFGYSGEIEKMGWIGCGKLTFPSASFTTCSYTSETDDLGQLSSFIYLPASNSVMQVFNQSSGNLPVGQSMKSILMGMQGAQLFSFYNERLVRSDSNQIEVTMDSISEGNLISILDAL